MREAASTRGMREAASTRGQAIGLYIYKRGRVFLFIYMYMCVCVCVCVEEDEESGFFLTGLDIENGNEDTADVDVLGCEVGGGQYRERSYTSSLRPHTLVA